MKKMWKRLGISLLAILIVCLLEWFMAVVSIMVSPDLLMVLFGLPLFPFLLLELICFWRNVRDLFLSRKRKENRIYGVMLCIVGIFVNLYGLYIAGQIGLLWTMVITMGE